MRDLIAIWRIRALQIEARSDELYQQEYRFQDALRYRGNAESLRSVAAELEEMVEKERRY